MADSLADFLTFVSPVCILILFFMCFFRFLFKSCECGAPTEDEESCQSSRPSSAEVVNCRNVSDLDPAELYGDVVFCQVHNEFPPRYEDALKMTPVNERSGSIVSTTDTSRRSSDLRVIPSPPPVYNEAVISIEEDAPSSASDAPPAYTYRNDPLNPSFFQRVQQAFTRRSINLNRASTPGDDHCVTLEKAQGRPATAVSMQLPQASVVNTNPMPSSSTSTSTVVPNRRYSNISTSTHGSVTRASPPRPTLPGAIEVDEDEESTSPSGNQEPHPV
uniref:Uncharacterized protein n=1 Tax=Panagrellus redivivus TaxID=6233 RepID=A0A7E4VDZ3_PANRE